MSPKETLNEFPKSDEVSQASEDCGLWQKEDINHVENGDHEMIQGSEKICERMAAGGYASGCCGLHPDVYCIVASAIILAIGILHVINNSSNWYFLLAGIVAVVVSVLGFIQKTSNYYCILMIVAIILAVLAIILVIMEVVSGGFKTDIHSIMNFVLTIIFIICKCDISCYHVSCMRPSHLFIWDISIRIRL
ncbi:hypothetical protein Y032_0210g2158 [Ancylostoma ceylanicum]|uniref:Uncharacterized protein n=1 Tax=Ancylostoma ceylanicum TaxID=53326 RepID=A0A016SLG3_9BILA|nr:hypothetical protein Y032_0210g2158 [Ancylostoma ceylanicum]